MFQNKNVEVKINEQAPIPEENTFTYDYIITTKNVDCNVGFLFVKKEYYVFHIRFGMKF